VEGAAWHERPVADVAGVGFGTSNLALAIALSERAAGDSRAVFFERQPRFGWHRGMLIDGATMQISFLKDLVTLRDPTSDFSFVSYLHQRDRLADFVNHQILMPTRVEFHDYLEWAADRLAHLVEYGNRVTDIRPVRDREDGVVRAVDLVVEDCARSGRTFVQRARNVVIGAGLRPRLPAGIPPSDRIWHSADYLDRLPELTTRPVRRVVVVGAGQSAVEIATHLLDTLPDTEVCAVFSRYGYSVADSSPFANRIFDPAGVDTFFGASSDVKASLIRYHANTNYSVADLADINELYRRYYAGKVRGTENLRILHASRIADMAVAADGVRVKVEFLPDDVVTELDADAVICATGYESSDPMTLLRSMAGYVERDDNGAPVVGRDYRVAVKEDMRCGIYLQGATEASHGISSTLLSNTAVRAGEIERHLR
jgi:L-ornithine N5-monooxygenase